MLREGSRGSDVNALQQWLADNGFDPGPIDGIFGPRTAAAVRAFQTEAGIQVDGIVGPETRGAQDGWTGSSSDVGGVGVDTDPAADPVGEGEGALGVLGGGTLVKVERPGAEDLWMMSYEWPAGSGQFVSFQFDNVEQLESVFGARWWESVAVTVENESYLDQVSVLDDAAGIIGTSGNFLQLMEDTMRNAAQIAGVTDPTLIGLITNNVEWQQLAAVAALGGWTDAQLTAELRQTDLWQNILYPGISSLFGQTGEPEALWVSYLQTVDSSLEALGYERDADGSYRSVIGEMLLSGVDSEAFIQNAEIFIRAEGSAEFHDALNLWVQRELGRDASFDEWFDVLAGTSSTEMGNIAELATLQFQADQTGLAISEEQLKRLAGNLNLNEAQMAAAFTDTERSLLAIGDENLQRFGLTQAELVSASAGISSEAGRSVEEIRQQAQIAATEMGLIDDASSALFVGFSPRGTPERPGLNPLAPQRA